MSIHPPHYDIVIAGAGFGGSITALALHNSGFKVCLIEKACHPRFAIGESSTPVADMILRSLSSTYNLPWLFDFSRYGSWQQSHPEIGCGIKRGFSYFKHYPGKTFFTDEAHCNELLVAASVSDQMSDTNWLRADFDAFLVNKVREYHIDYFDSTDIIAAVRENSKWTIHTKCMEQTMLLTSGFFIDATGSGNLADRLFSVSSTAADFLTHSFAVFSHFDHLPRWSTLLQEKNISTVDYPYDPDNSALHHLLDEGWVWALRFNNERTSWGFALSGNDASFKGMTTSEIWSAMRNKYPDINRLLKNAALSPLPGNIIQSGRLQRRLVKGFGNGWLALPHTIGFVDPLFSTGIACTLSGVERVVKMLCMNRDFGPQLYEQLKMYEQVIFEELKLIDMLVAGCYATMKHFQLFNAWSMLYFTFTIMYEQRRLKNLPAGYFLEADNSHVQNMAQTAYHALIKLVQQPAVSSSDADAFTNMVREMIKPFNTAGLLDPLSKNMYHHTVAEL